MVGISPPECLVSNLRPGNVVAGVASGSMDEPLPKVSTTLGLSGRELGVLSPFKTSRDPLFFLPPSLRGQRNRGRLFGLDTGLGLGLGLTEGQLSGSELASPLFLGRSLNPFSLCLGLRKVSLSGEQGALRMFRTSRNKLGSDSAMDIEVLAEVSTKVLAACFFLDFDLSFLSFLPATGSFAWTTGVSPTGERSLFSAMVFIQRGSWGIATATMDIKPGF